MQGSPPAIPSGLRIPDGMVSEGLALVYSRLRTISKSSLTIVIIRYNRAHPVDTQPYQIRYGVIEVTIAGQFDWNLL
jgi:hypothetical protein